MYKTILIPVDLNQLEKVATMIEAATELGDSDAQIILLNVIEKIATRDPGMGSANNPASVHPTAREVLKSLKKLAGITAEILVRSGNVHQRILEVAEESRVDLIVITSLPAEESDNFLGSTASKVVRDATIPVFVIR